MVEDEVFRTSAAVVKKGLTVLAVRLREPLALTAFFIILRGIRGGSIAAWMGSQYAFEKGSIDLIVGSRGWC